MIELSAVALHAMTTMPSRMTCPRAKVWMRRHCEPARDAAIPELTEALLDMMNTPNAICLAFLIIVVISKYAFARR